MSRKADKHTFTQSKKTNNGRKYEIGIHLPNDEEQTMSMRKRKDKGLILRGILYGQLLFVRLGENVIN